MINLIGQLVNRGIGELGDWLIGKLVNFKRSEFKYE
jgi:hypothetical protein